MRFRHGERRTNPIATLNTRLRGEDLTSGAVVITLLSSRTLIVLYAFPSFTIGFMRRKTFRDSGIFLSAGDAKFGEPKSSFLDTDLNVGNMSIINQYSQIRTW